MHNYPSGVVSCIPPEVYNECIKDPDMYSRCCAMLEFLHKVAEYKDWTAKDKEMRQGCLDYIAGEIKKRKGKI